MKPLAEFDARAVSAVLLDVDDTLTTGGKLTAQAYAALEALQCSGRRTVAVTGRAAGFCEYAARMWPLDAVVGENGGFHFSVRDGHLRRTYGEAADVRARNRERLAVIGRMITATVPGCAIAADARYRETDLAIDYSEEVSPLPLALAQRIAELMRREGLRVTMSSIHVHGWFGGYDKLSMTKQLFREQFAMDLDRARAAAVYVGDSPNDAPMFEFFPNSVGVANIRRFAGMVNPMPKYVTREPSGAGFAELAEHLLS